MISWQIPAHELMIMQKDGQPWRLGQGGLSLGDLCGAWRFVQCRSSHWQVQMLLGAVQTFKVQLMLKCPAACTPSKPLLC